MFVYRRQLNKSLRDPLIVDPKQIAKYLITTSQLNLNFQEPHQSSVQHRRIQWLTTSQLYFNHFIQDRIVVSQFPFLFGDDRLPSKRLLDREWATKMVFPGDDRFVRFIVGLPRYFKVRSNSNRVDLRLLTNRP